MKEASVKKHGLKVNFIFNLISQVVTVLIPLITTPYLARVLHEVGNGQISYASSIITYFILFSNLGFAIYGQREIAKFQDNKEEKSKVFWEIFVLRTVLVCISLTVLYSVSLTCGFGDNYNKLIMIMSIQVLAVMFDIQFLFYGDEDFCSLAIRTIFLKLIGLICIFVFVKTENDTWIYALCLSASTILSNLIMWFTLFRHIKFTSIKNLKPWKHILPTLIIFIPTLVTSIFTTFDKTMIGLLSSNPDYDNGCYEQAYKINSIAQILITLLSTVMMSRNTYDYQNGNIENMVNHIYSTSNYVWFVSLPLVAGFLTLSHNMSSWFLGEGYVEVPLLLWIMCVRLLTSGFSVILGDRFIVIGKELFWTISVAVGALTNVAINYLMIPAYGAVGAAIATAITETLILVSMICFTLFQKKYKYGFSLKHIFCMCWKYLIAALTMFGVMFAMQYFMHYSVWEFIVIGAVGVITYLLVLLILRDKFLIDFCHKIRSSIFSLLNRKKKIENEENVDSQFKDTQEGGEK